MVSSSVSMSPWSSVSKNVGEVSSMRDAMLKAKMNYNIVKEPLHRSDGSPIANYFGVMREDTRQVFDIVKNTWQPLQNEHCFDFFTPALEENLITIDSVGAIRGGERAFIVAKINEPPVPIVPGDIINKFMILLNSHNSKSSIRVGFIPVRFSCTNQLASIMRNRQSQILKIRHCRSPKDSLESLREVLNLANSEFSATQEKLQFLASKPINYKDLEKYVRVVMSIKEDEEGNISTRSRNMMEQIIALSVHGMGNDNPNVKGTFYGAYNGITEYLNYHAGRNVDNRLESLWLGQNANINSNALAVALQMAG